MGARDRILPRTDGGFAVLRFCGLTDVGRKRSENEDRFHISNDRQYCILADGMGGRLYGEVASEMAVNGLAGHIEDDLPMSIGRLDRSEQATMATNMLDEWIREVNVNVFQRGEEDERYREMGTTLVCLLSLDKQVVLAHVGDSRCYQWNPRAGMRQLTEDHSFVNSQLKQGVITEEEARDSAQRNIITRAVGTAAKVKPDIRAFPAQVGDRFLLCSDGLTDMIDDEGIEVALAAGQDMETTVKSLVDQANAAGGRDNITVIIAEEK